MAGPTCQITNRTQHAAASEVLLQGRRGKALALHGCKLLLLQLQHLHL